MVTVLQGNRKQTNHREPGNATQVSDTNQWGFIIVNQGKYFKPPIGQYIIYVTRGQSKYVYMTLVVGSISYNYCSKNEYIQHGRVYMGCLVYISHVGICLAHRAEFLRVNKSCLPLSTQTPHTPMDTVEPLPKHSRGHLSNMFQDNSRSGQHAFQDKGLLSW